jgi:kinesin family member 5
MIGMDDDDEAREEIQVFIRVRPTISEESKYGKVVNVSAGQSISVKFDKYDTTCKYNRVFDERSSQSDVFDSVKPLLSSVLNGFNACVFAYGQTSAGKSHTMLGPGGGTQSVQKTLKADLGLIPRAVEYIFNSMSKQADDGYLSYNVKASFVQIYNENLHDLLKNTKEGSGEEKYGGLAASGRASDELLKIREIPKSGGSGTTQQYEVRGQNMRSN